MGWMRYDTMPLCLAREKREENTWDRDGRKEKVSETGKLDN